MNQKTLSFLLFMLFLSASNISALEEPMVFPKEGQSKEVQRQDKMYCNMWAKDETGVDPSYIRAKMEATHENIQRTATGREPSVGRRLLRGAALGAAMGGIDDGIDNNIGKRAVQGVVLSGSRTRRDRREYQQNQELNYQVEKKDLLLEQYNKYTRAFSVCMDAKGYSVR